MRRSLLLLSSMLLLMTCATNDWDNGAKAKESFEEERRQEQVEALKIQFPDARPGTEEAQPF
ncbi:MAG: hypothetical protein AB7I27_13610 [Bacteriovoracaceae bacterium]